MPQILPAPTKPRRRRRLLLALLVCCALVLLAGCTSRPAPLEDPPAVPSEAATFDTAAIETAVDAMLTAGAPAVLVEVRDGDEVWRYGVGVTSVLEEGRPDPLAPVRIASVTKSMLGALLMQLVAEGELDLDEPIATYLPELRLGREVLTAEEAAKLADGETDGGEESGGSDPEAEAEAGAETAGGEDADAAPGDTDTDPGATELVLEPSPAPTGPDWVAPGDENPPTAVPDGAVAGSDVVFDAAGAALIDPATVVTTRMLAQHTAGLPEYTATFPVDDLANLGDTLEHEYSLDELVARVAAEPWTSTPGEAFNYSNTNYLVLSMLVEQLTGDAVDEALQERIFDGGGLDETALPDDAAMPDGAAHGYFAHEGVFIDVTQQSGTLWSGAGGVVSTVGDVNSFFRGLMQGTFLHADELHEMLTLGADGYGIGIQGRLDVCEPGEPVYVLPPGAEGHDDASADAAADESEAAESETAETAETEEAEEAEAPTDASSDADAPGDGGRTGDGEAPIDPGQAGAAEVAVEGDGAGEALPDASPSAPGTSGTPDATPDPGVQIGEPGMTYGHLGSGLGYRILSFSSPDGLRQVTVSWTASPIDYGADPRLEPAQQVVDAAFAATCP